MDKNLFQVNISAIVLNELGEVLLLKRSLKEEVYPGLWCIPGGKLDNTDYSLEDALAREVKEEVGITVKFEGLVQNNTSIKPDLNKLYLVVRARYLEGTPAPLEDTDEVKWVSKEEWDFYDFTPYTLELLKSVL